ncbi:MAG: hypothetical protein R6W70_05840 [bacterium]
MRKVLFFLLLNLFIFPVSGEDSIEDELSKLEKTDFSEKDNDENADEIPEKKFGKSESAEEESSSVENGSKIKILVQNIESVNMDESVGQILLEAVIAELGERKDYEVVSAEELSKIAEVSEEAFKMGCMGSQECMIAVQEKLHASLIVSGRVGMLAEELVLTLNTVDVENNMVGERVSIEGSDTRALISEIPEALNLILGESAKKAMFSLAEGEELQIAVMPLSAQGIEKSTVDALTQILSAELNSIQGVSVTGRDDIEAMLSKVEMDAQLDCLDNLQCVVEIGASFGLSKLVTGSVGKIKNNWVVSTKLIDVREASVLNRVLESYDGDEDELKNAVRLSAYRLTGVDFREKTGGVNFSFNIREGEIQFSGDKKTMDSGNFLKDNLVPGRYYLKVADTSEKYLPMQTDVYIPPGAVNVKTMTLIEAPRPWYKTWWFWTITGTVVAGAGATTVILLTMDDSGWSGTVSGN